MKKFDRRSFLKTSSLSAAAIASTSLLSSCVEPKVASKGIYMGGFVAPKMTISELHSLELAREE
jgi:hypothetical protein